VLSFALAGVALWVVYGRGSELQASLFEHLQWGWLLPMVVVEGASLVCFARMQSRLLATGGVAAPGTPLAGVTFASQAITNSFPGGAALAAVFSFRWYRRFGADDSLAGWTLVGVLIGATLSLALVAAGGVALAADTSADLGLVPVVVGVLVLSLGTAVLFVKQEWVLSGLRRLVRRHRSPGRSRVALSKRMNAVLRRLGAFRLGWRGMGLVVGWGLGTWLLDCTCFALAFLAVRAPVPWGAILLAYGAGQLAANLPITPGGLGVVEGSIEAALVLFGGVKTGTVQAVFVYRLISFWFELVVGWSSAGILALGVRRGRWSRVGSDGLLGTGELAEPADPTDAAGAAGARATRTPGASTTSRRSDG
jgi:uncharacterized membrane protein YbhN (UPF0104 family)